MHAAIHYQYTALCAKIIIAAYYGAIIDNNVQMKVAAVHPGRMVVKEVA
jgi:hypothetical protein